MSDEPTCISIASKQAKSAWARLDAAYHLLLADPLTFAERSELNEHKEQALSHLRAAIRFVEES